MASVPVPNVAEVEVRASLAGVPVENTLYFLLDGVMSGAALDDLAVAIGDWWVSEMLPQLAAGYVMREVFARDLSSGSAFAATYPGVSGAAGSFTGDALPGNVAWVVKFLTALTGRSYRGRNFIAGISEAVVSGNILGVTNANNIKGAYQMLLGGGGALPADWTWGVVSRFTGGAPRVTGAFTPVSAVSYTDLKVDSQRKRLS